MTKKPDYYNRCLESFKHLRQEYPSSTLGKHLEIAFSDYSNMFSVTDKELSHALDKYISELDFNNISDKEIEKLVKDTEVMFEQLESDDYQDSYDSDFEDDY